MSEGRDPQLYPEETVDRIESEVLGTEKSGSERTDGRDSAHSDEEPAPIHDQDKDVEDMPGGAGEKGGSAPEPAD